MKRGLSEMVGYVLLIGMGITLALLVFFWLRQQVPAPKEFCPEDLSIQIYNKSCNNNQMTIIVKNTGLFDIDGIIAKANYIGQGKTPIENLKYLGGGTIDDKEKGVVYFNILDDNRSLIPDEKQSLSFEPEDNIFSFSVQAFIIKDKLRVLCDNAIVEEEILC